MTLVALGDVDKPPTLLSCLGFLIMAGLSARGMRGAILIGILVIGAARHSVRPDRAAWGGFGTALTGADVPATGHTPERMSLGVTTVVLTFLLVDVLDNAGTLIATTQRAGLMRPDGTVPRLREALMADSGGAIIGSVLGTSTTTSYIESAAGHPGRRPHRAYRRRPSQCCSC